ncbi:MAG TPA: hypothetical protein VFX98_13865 [Longimicrobiaceae bacterium]|nr:hypothetical protein [Longimicrobiaceae bacterium]
MLRRLLASAAALVLALALTRCGNSPTDPPPDVAHIFVLQSINADPVPSVYVQDPTGVLEVVADSLWLYVDGTGAQHTVQRHTPAGGPPEVFHTESSFGYTLEDGHLVLNYECNDVVIQATASCAPPPHATGELSDDEATLTLTPIGFAVSRVYVYRRLESPPTPID